MAKGTNLSLWKVLVPLQHHLKEHEYWVLGNGTTVSAWHHKWLDWDTKLADLNLDIPHSMLQCTVADLVSNHGLWEFEKMQWMPEDLLTRLKSIPPPSCHDGEDMSLWPGSKDGSYTVSAGYNYLCNSTAPTTDKWSSIWKLPTKERVRSFVWLLTHDRRLLTNVRKAKMLLGTPDCHHCRDVPETTLHVMRDCSLALPIWLHLVKQDMRKRFFECSLQEWIQLNMQCQLSNDHNSYWPAVWATACHSLWFWRNKMEHDPDFVAPWQPWTCILKDVADYNQIVQVHSMQQKKIRITKEIRWLPLPENWIKLNTNGSSNCNCGIAGCGGLFRDHCGNWLGGFTKSLGSCGAHIAELWGIFEGLIQANIRNYKHIIVESDSAHIVDLMNTGAMGRSDGWCLIRKIRNLIAAGDWQVNFLHCYKEANQSAHHLACIGSTQPQDLQIHDNLPTDIVRFFSDDLAGTTFPRRIAV